MESKNYFIVFLWRKAFYAMRLYFLKSIGRQKASFFGAIYRL